MWYDEQLSAFNTLDSVDTITGEVWRELRPSMDTEPGSLVLDAQSQTMVQVVQVREAQGVYHRDK